MTKKFLDYFPNQEEYPRAIAFRLLPVGSLWEYVSETFLNGLINYVTPIKAYVLGRYRPWFSSQSHQDETIHLQVREPPNSFNWVKVAAKDKDEAFKLLTEPGRVLHLNLKDFDDNIVILAHPKDAKGYPEAEKMYYFFWFDCDVSDCVIGRFVTDDPEEKVAELFAEYIQEIDDNPYGARELPLHIFKSGWVRF